MSAATDAAALYAKQTLGLPDDKTRWTDSQKRAYLAAVAEFRQANAAMFTPEELAAADNYGSAALVQDEEFSLGGATWNAFKESVAELPGRINAGIDNAAKAVGLAIPTWLKWVFVGTAAVYVLSLIRPYLGKRK